MIHLLPGRRRRVPLRGLDPRHLELQKELGHLDRQIPTHRPDARLRREVHVELLLERGEVGVAQRAGRRELAEGERERGLRGCREVDGGEGDAARGDVGDVGEGGLGRGAGDAGLDGGDGVGDFFGEGRVADDEARVALAFGDEGDWGRC